MDEKTARKYLDEVIAAYEKSEIRDLLSIYHSLAQIWIREKLTTENMRLLVSQLYEEMNGGIDLHPVLIWGGLLHVFRDHRFKMELGTDARKLNQNEKDAYATIIHKEFKRMIRS